MSNAKFSVIYSKDNLPIPVINKQTIHSQYFPLREGEKIAKKFLETTTKVSDTLLVIGFGFGYHLLPLLSKFKIIYCFEPSQPIKEYLKKNNLLEKYKKVKFIDNVSQIKENHYNTYSLTSITRIFKDECENFYSEKIKINNSKIKILMDYPIYGGSLTTAQYLKSAFKELNYNIEIYDNSDLKDFFVKVIELNNQNLLEETSDKLISLTSNLFLDKINKFQPDICLFNAQSPISMKALHEIKAQGIFVIFAFVEDYRRFNYWKSIAKEVDLFWTIQKGKFHQELIKLGCKNPIYLPMAASENYHFQTDFSLTDQKEYNCEISFMGAGYLNRHLLFNHLLDYDLKIWGTGWNDNPRLKNHIMKNGERVSIEETAKIYKYSKININLHSSNENEIFEKNGDFINPRTFEILACGGFQLVDKRTLLSEIFIDGDDIVTFSSIPDLKNKIEFYLNNPKERERISKNGQQKVLNHHLYKHRVKRLIDKSLQLSTSLKEKLKHRNSNLKDKLNRIKDDDFKKLIKRYPLDKFNLDDLVKILREKNNTFTRSEIILNIIQTFQKGE